MSQKEGRFQSKSGKFGGGGKGKGRPGGGGFGKKFEGDRGGFKGGGKRFEGGGSRGGPPRGAGAEGGGERREYKPRFEGGGGGGFKKPYRDRAEGGGFKGREDRAGGGDRPYKKPFRAEGGGGGYKGREGGGGDRPYKKPFRAEGGGGGYKGRDDRGGFKGREGGGGDRPFKKPFREREGGGGGDRPFKKPFRDRDSGGGDFKPREGGFRGREGAGGDRPYKKPFRDRDSGGGDFKPREDRGGDRPFKKPFREGGGGDFKPREGGGGFKSREGGGFKGRDGAGESRPRAGDRHKPYKRNFENRDFEPRERKPFRAREESTDDFTASDFALDSENGVAEVSEVTPFEAKPETRQRLKSDRPGYGAPSSAYLYGVHAVRAALQNPRRTLQRLLVTDKGYESVREAYDAASNAGLKLPEPTYVQMSDLERLLPRDAVHQGVLLDAQPAEEVFLADILLTAPEHAKILVLDQVTDPHNVGAILRSAAVFGALAVVVQKLHAPDITGTLAKSASGAAELVPMVKEVNLTRALEQMKEAGFFCIGLAEEGKETLSVLAPTGKVALVLGAEGEGLRRLVSETCDTLAKLPTSGSMSSLNVSNAAAVALYELTRGQ